MQFTNTYTKTQKAVAKGNIIVSCGGTRSSKTYSILQMLYLIAVNFKARPLIISVVSESFPHLKRGCIRDFESILENVQYTGLSEQNKSNSTYKFGANVIEFFSVDNAGKVRGAQRDILFVNECNRIDYETIRQLMIRTSGKKIFDYNPVAPFWIDEKILPRDDCEYIHSTYLDNNFLSAEQVAEIESNKNDANWWRVFGLGQIGRLEGLVFPEFETCDEFPVVERWSYGLDFGFMADPTALVKLAIVGDKLYLDEQLYQRGLINADIVLKMRNLGINRNDTIIADVAEQKSIEEIHREQFNIKPCTKGKDSIMAGIDKIKKYKLFVTKRSLNLIDELRNYTWEQDKDGKYLNKPIDKFNHLIDATRYGLQGLNSGSYNFKIV